MKIEDKNKKSTALVEVEAEMTHLTPSDQGLAPLGLSDYSQFLYATNYGGKAGQGFTAEGIKTIGLQNGISTGEAQQQLSVAWSKRDESLGHIDKLAFYKASQIEYGDSEYWDADTWKQVTDDLKNLVDWVKSIAKSPF